MWIPLVGDLILVTLIHDQKYLQPSNCYSSVLDYCNISIPLGQPYIHRTHTSQLLYCHWKSALCAGTQRHFPLASLNSNSHWRHPLTNSSEFLIVSQIDRQTSSSVAWTGISGRIPLMKIYPSFSPKRFVLANSLPCNPGQ